MMTPYTMVFKNLPRSDPFNMHIHYQEVNIKLGFIVI